MIHKEVRKPVEIRPDTNKQPVLYILIPREIRSFFEGKEVYIYFDDETGALIALPEDNLDLLRKFI